MPGYPLPPPRFVGLDVHGRPLSGGLLSAYAAGTSTPAPVYSNAALSSQHTQPVTLDSRGEAAVYLFPGIGYKLILTNARGVVQWTRDDVKSAIPPTEASLAVDVPAGAMFPWPSDTPPASYLLCDGTAVSRVLYAALFAAIGVTFGSGDGVSTFHVPDLRGRFPIGKAASGTAGVLGATGGVLDHTHAITAHSHTLTDAGAHSHTAPRTGWGDTITPAIGGHVVALNNTHGPQQIATVTVPTDAASNHTHTVAAGGSSVSGDANPPFRTLNFVVKV